MDSNQIIPLLPYKAPFLFVDEILQVDENGIKGTYTYPADSYFYKGHFKNNPITPGVILTETMAQIGLVSLGIYILQKENKQLEDVKIAMTSTAIDFYKPVFPSNKVWVESEKEIFRFNKLKCKVKMLNQNGDLMCRGTIAGMMK